MNTLAVTAGTVLCGAATSLLAVLLNTTVLAYTGVNVFRFMDRFIIPLGAIGLGLLAAGGFYAGATFLHRRATPPLLVLMVFLTALTHAMMYWCEARWVAPPVMRTGVMGALTLLLEFAGLLVGTIAVYLQLQLKPECMPCGRYLRKLYPARSKIYGSSTAANGYSMALRSTPMDSPDFGAMAALRCNAGTVEGAFAIHTSLMQCPACNAQVLSENVAVFHSRFWHRIDGRRRRIDLPDSVDLSPYFRR